MPVYRLDKRQTLFPPPSEAEPDGLLAVGGDLSPKRLLVAYASGIFPWYDEKLPILWHSPDPRFVLEARSLHVPKSLAKELRRRRYEIRLDTRFADVIARCARISRPTQKGTWINRDMIHAYTELHELGFAHSAEAYLDGELVGGLYGVSLGGAYFGESMFADAPDASKVAFATLVRFLETRGIPLIDCQVHTDHLARFGAEMWPRERYLEHLTDLLARPTLRGRWSLESESGLEKGEES